MNPTKRNNKKNYKRNESFRIPPPLSDITLRDVCPDTIHVPLVYHDRQLLNGAFARDQVYNLNSCFDPDRTGVGHQPLGFDQWSTFYNRYRVDKAKVEVTFLNVSANTVPDILLMASNDATAIITVAPFDSACESPFSVRDMLQTNGGGNSVRRWVKTYNLNQVTGVTAVKYKDDDLFAATTGASPNEVIVAHVAAQDILFAANIGVFIDVKITMFTTFYDRNQLAQS
jgi:hypothetical protein